MKLWQLEAALGDVEPFADPKIEWEQYHTTPHIASQYLYAADTRFGDIEGMSVCDLGCGCGVLGIGAALLGAEHVVGVDIDPESLDIARRNADEIGVHVDFITCDVSRILTETEMDAEAETETETEIDARVNVDAIAHRHLGSTVFRSLFHSHLRDGAASYTPPFDTVVMNPPFGTRSHGIDMTFLRTACMLASRAVYSLHKSSTRAHIVKTVSSWGASVEIVAELRFDLPKTYAFQKSEKSVDIEVDLLRLVPGTGGGSSSDAGSSGDKSKSANVMGMRESSILADLAARERLERIENDRVGPGARGGNRNRGKGGQAGGGGSGNRGRGSGRSNIGRGRGSKR